MNIRSFFLATTLLGGILTLIAGSPVFADRRCSYACEVVGPDGAMIRYRPTSRPSAAHVCSSNADCTQSLCASFCAGHPPADHPDYSAGCSSTQAPTCPSGSRTSTSAPTGATTPSTGVSGGSGGTTATPGATASGAAPTGDSTAASTIGAGHCAYQCQRGSVTHDIGATVSCATDAECATDCSSRCGQASPAGSSSGNGLGSFTGSCAASPAPHCVLPAGASGSSASTGPSAPSGAGASVSELPNPIGTNDITVIFGRIVRAVLGLVGALALFWFVWGGILWMTARGDKGEVKKAQEIIKNAAIGILIIFFAYTLTSAFLGVFEAARGASSTASSSKTSTTNSSN